MMEASASWFLATLMTTSVTGGFSWQKYLFSDLFYIIYLQIHVEHPPMPGLELGSWSLSRETSWCKVKVRRKHAEDCPSSKVRGSQLVEGGWWKGTGHDLGVLIHAWHSCHHVVCWPLKTLPNQPSSLQFKYIFSSDLRELGHVTSSCCSDAIVASESTFSTKALSGLRSLLGKWVVLSSSVILSLCAEWLLCLHIEQQSSIEFSFLGLQPIVDIKVLSTLWSF